MNDQSYIYNEDSRLMGDVLATLEDGKSFLEIGTGNGGNLREVANKFDLIVGTDLASLFDARKGNRSAELIVTDRATCFRRDSFDVVAFNPPYLPSGSIVDKSVDGGPCGIEVPLQFLESALGVIRKEGKILILVSSESDLSAFRDFCLSHSLKMRTLGEKALFFEILQVFELTSSR